MNNMNENHGTETGNSSLGTPPLDPVIVQLEESDALEELLRRETLRHLAAAWAAHRRVLMACLPLHRPIASPKGKPKRTRDDQGGCHHEGRGNI